MDWTRQEAKRHDMSDGNTSCLQEFWRFIGILIPCKASKQAAINQQGRLPQWSQFRVTVDTVAPIASAEEEQPFPNLVWSHLSVKKRQ